MSSREHLDLGLTVREAGGTVHFEPESRITYMTPPPLEWSDIPFFVRRWSDAWNVASVEHFYDKWGLHKDVYSLLRKMELRRRVVFEPVRGIFRRVGGDRGVRLFDKVFRRVEPRANRLLFPSSRNRPGAAADLRHLGTAAAAGRQEPETSER